jgi:hypothetical protein
VVNDVENTSSGSPATAPCPCLSGRPFADCHGDAPGPAASAAVADPLPKSLFTIKATLAELFPPDDLNSSWLLRLAVLRDDLEHELKPKTAVDDEAQGTWLEIYRLRKLSITLGELKNIFSHEVRTFLATVDWPTDVVRAVADLTLAVEDLTAKLQPVRDALAAHVRPANAVQAKPKIDPTPEVLRAHGGMEIEVVLDMKTGRETSLCGLTSMAFVFAWPEVRTQEDYARRRTEIGPVVLLESAMAVRQGIDLLLAHHWERRGLLK